MWFVVGEFDGCPPRPQKHSISSKNDRARACQAREQAGRRGPDSEGGGGGRSVAPQNLNFVVWLSSEENSYITGQNIAIDGGFTRV